MQTSALYFYLNCLTLDLNLRVIFSIGAGVDHILKLSNIKNIPIIRVKDPAMRLRMYNHVLSQILIFQE